MKKNLAAMAVSILVSGSAVASSANIISANASAYDMINNHIPQNVIDGNLKTRWAAQGKDISLLLELEYVTDLDNIVVIPFKAAERSLKFDLFTSMDGDNWSLISKHILTSKNKEQGEKFTFKPVKAKFIKLLTHGTDVNNWSAIWEIYANSDDPKYAVTNLK